MLIGPSLPVSIAKEVSDPAAALGFKEKCHPGPFLIAGRSSPCFISQPADSVSRPGPGALGILGYQARSAGIPAARWWLGMLGSCPEGIGGRESVRMCASASA